MDLSKFKENLFYSFEKIIEILNSIYWVFIHLFAGFGRDVTYDTCRAIDQRQN
jgi:hypothetical protein